MLIMMGKAACRWSDWIRYGIAVGKELADVSGARGVDIRRRNTRGNDEVIIQRDKNLRRRVVMESSSEVERGVDVEWIEKAKKGRSV